MNNLICVVSNFPKLPTLLIKVLHITMKVLLSSSNQRRSPHIFADIIPLTVTHATNCHPSFPHICSYMGPIQVWGWQRLTDLQTNSSQTYQSRHLALFGLARGQQGWPSSAFLKFKNSALCQLEVIAFLPPTLHINVNAHTQSYTDTHLRIPHNSCPISHQTGDLSGLEVCGWHELFQLSHFLSI